MCELPVSPQDVKDQPNNPPQIDFCGESRFHKLPNILDSFGYFSSPPPPPPHFHKLPNILDSFGYFSSSPPPGLRLGEGLMLVWGWGKEKQEPHFEKQLKHSQNEALFHPTNIWNFPFLLFFNVLLRLNAYKDTINKMKNKSVHISFFFFSSSCTISLHCDNVETKIY